MEISATQALELDDYFRREQKGGNYTEYDFANIIFLDISNAQRGRIWALIYNNKKEDLIDMLFSIGLKVKKDE